MSGTAGKLLSGPTRRSPRSPWRGVVARALLAMPALALIGLWIRGFAARDSFIYDRPAVPGGAHGLIVATDSARGSFFVRVERAHAPDPSEFARQGLSSAPYVSGRRGFFWDTVAPPPIDTARGEWGEVWGFASIAETDDRPGARYSFRAWKSPAWAPILLASAPLLFVLRADRRRERAVGFPVGARLI